MEVRQKHLAGRPEAARSEESPGAQDGRSNPREKERSPAKDGRTHTTSSSSQLALDAYIAVDPSSRRIVEKIRQLAQGSATVLVRGEMGVGKDFVAWLLHELSSRREEPLARLDCASLPQELLESDLFGENGTRSRFEITGRGTLVLDEIAALSMKLQSRLLHVIESRGFERNGRRIPIEARLIVSTSVDLERAVARRSFREDLYYRLGVTPLVIPPLRERPADIQPLSDYFLSQLSQMHRRPRPSLNDEVIQALQTFSFPGNVRQLRNILERVLLASTSPIILPTDLPAEVRPGSARAVTTLEDVERAYIEEVLHATRGQKSKAAEILGISRKTLLEKRKRYGLE